MKILLKKTWVILMAVISAFSFMSFAACGDSAKDTQEKITAFYDTVVESQTCMDELADDIYIYWYDAIYKDKYRGDINLAIAYAQAANSENLEMIEANEPKIQSLYKEVRNSELSVEIKAVMAAYSDYYEFVVNVSGSFNTYSSSKETLKKELATALKNLALEI